jgi:ABC-type nitrate/sulfonate/bicarbonate transport system permease component
MESKGTFYDYILPTLVIVAMFVIWELVVIIFAIPRFILPAPTAVWASLVTVVSSHLDACSPDTLHHDGWASSLRLSSVCC